MMRRAFLLAVVSAVLLFPAAVSRGADSAKPETGSELKVDPAVIRMGAFFDGSQVRVTGRAPSGSEVIVIVRGPDAKEVLNRKKRVGPIWVNQGKVRISGVPTLFLSFSPRPVAQMLSRETIDKFQLDERSIKVQMQVEPKAMDQPLIREHFFKMKSQQNAYQVRGDISGKALVPGSDRHFDLAFHWSKKAPPGGYKVSAYICRGGSLEAIFSADLKVEEVGFPAWMTAMAKNRASLYGALAVIVALLAGLGIDFAASRLGRRRIVAH
ncbi:MAG: TIGR02186 family protein [Acidobacteriota bacterium]|jgi:uncharacterized protein (TIGR02186 family)